MNQQQILEAIIIKNRLKHPAMKMANNKGLYMLEIKESTNSGTATPANNSGFPKLSFFFSPAFPFPWLER